MVSTIAPLTGSWIDLDRVFDRLLTESIGGSRSQASRANGVMSQPMPVDLYATDDEAVAAFQLLSRLEGIIPALEPAHALARVADLAPTLPSDHLMVVNLSGRGDKDLDSVAAYLGGAG